MEVKVRSIESAIGRLAKDASQEPVWIDRYGSFDIHPRHLAYWICVKTDAERDRLKADDLLVAKLRQTLIDNEYPLEGRDHVHIGFESQETVDRKSKGNWGRHFT